MKKNKENMLKVGAYNETLQKAKVYANLENFDEFSIYQYTVETYLRGREVEYENNFNARHMRNTEIYDEKDEFVKICKKSNSNPTRQKDIVKNQNVDSDMDYQYIVYHKNLGKFMRDKLEEVKIKNIHMKYGKLNSKELNMLNDIFPEIAKEWLVIDGNTYFATVHQAWLAKKTDSYKDLPEVEKLSRKFARKASKGKGYDCTLLEGKDEYEQSLQFVQLVSLVLEKNKNTWAKEEITSFEKILVKLLHIFCYHKYMSTESCKSVADYFKTLSCTKYIILPNIGNSYTTRKVDYITLCSLFEDVDNEVVLETTTFNKMKMLSNIIENTIVTKNSCLHFDYAFDCINEIFIAMVNYQKHSLNIAKKMSIPVMKRDRLYNIQQLWQKENKNNSKEALLYDDIVVKRLPISVIKRNLEEIVEKLVVLFVEEINNTFADNLKNNKTVQKSLGEIYNNRTSYSYNEFFNKILEMIKNMDSEELTNETI